MTGNDVEATKGVIFNIQTYSIHDGPGIRTTVFLKGCPLRCLWCQNPESQVLQPEIFFDSEKCTGCGKCVQACPNGAIEICDGHSRTNRELCQGSGKCAEVCPNEARNIMGKHVTAGDVFKEVAADSIFYQRSGGGVTLGGGEPLAQPQFAVSLLKLCKDAGIHTALDTCGYARWETMKRVLEYVDLVLYDFKHMDPVEHEKHTEVSNDLILDNVRKIHHDLSIPIIARVPVIPGYNDSIKNIEATSRFITAELGDSTGVHLLPYHKLGETKYDRLERAESAISITPSSEEHMSELQKIFESFGLIVHTGG
ncbi:MAG TPA: glycyl-radical enzyme activating protein [Dehalococcoidia bacterium]|nr:glycyl-radical enzyme activating protein [Dehalococcoidia bacterium]